MLNNKQKHTHKESNGEPHQQDNCEGCQSERKQNNMLVNFYERLGNIETKVDKIKEQVSNQQQTTVSYRQKIQKMATVLLKKPDLSIEQIKQHNSKEMGYELASALIQRQMKTRLQNQRLQAIIDQLLKDKKKLSEQKQKFNESENRDDAHVVRQRKKELFTGQTQYKDALDDVRRTKSIESTYFIGSSKQQKMGDSYFVKGQNKNYWEYSEGHVDTNSTSFASESKKQKTRAIQNNQYAGLNLWLYQFKTEEIDQNPIKSLRKPSKNNIGHVKQRKYKSKF